jgi:hypothetical protein
MELQWNGFVYGTRAMMSDQQLMSDLLSELDSVIGCATRIWQVDSDVLVRPQPASFFLSGVAVGPNSSNGTMNSTITSGLAAGVDALVWRFTPSIPILDGRGDNVRGMVTSSAGERDDGGGELRVGPLLFDGDRCELVFNGGVLLPVPNLALAPFGVWIAQTGGSSIAAEVRLVCGGSARAWPIQRP